jgi:hypothetical protein
MKLKSLLFDALYARSRLSMQRFEGVTFLAILEAGIIGYGIISGVYGGIWPYVQGTIACGMAFSFFIRLLAEARGYSGARWLQHGGTLLFSIGSYIVLHSMPLNDYTFMYMWGAIGALCCFALYFLYTDQNGGALFPHFVSGIISAIGISILLIGALSVCLLAFSTLLFTVPGQYYQVLIVFVLLVPGLNLFLSFLPERASGAVAPTAFYKILVRALLPIYLLLMIILYGYILKIAAMGTMPSGQMNWYASLAVGGYTVFYLSLADGTIYPKITRYIRWGVLLLVPILIVQLIGVYIRYEAYGLTTARFASMICIAYGMVVMAVSFMRYRQAFLYALAGILITVFFLTPINIIDIPSWQQQSRLMELLEKNGLYKDGEIIAKPTISAEDRAKIYGSYAYLKQSVSVNKFSFAQQAAESPVLKALASEVGKRYIRLTNRKPNSLSVAGYNTLYEFDMKNSEGQLTITVENGETIQYDISSFVAQLYDAYKDKGAKQTVELQYKPDAGTLLYFKNINIRKEENSNGFHIDGSGYMLR